MKQLLMIFALGTFSSASYATCYGKGIQRAPTINVDLSDKLSPTSPTWSSTYNIQFSGSFTCKTSSSEFGYTEMLTPNDAWATVLEFNNGKYYDKAQITNVIGNKKLSGKGSHNASELGQTINVPFTLVDKPDGSISASGDTNNLGDIFLVSDLSEYTDTQKSDWLGLRGPFIVSWLSSGFKWSFYNQRDMYSQPMNVTYAPKSTTCSFTDSGMSVVLPTIGKNQVLSQVRPGYTPFTLNMRCDNLGADKTTDRNITIFLSSNTLLSGDPTVLIDCSPPSAKGVGLRLVKHEAPQNTEILSEPLSISDYLSPIGILFIG